MDFQSADPSVVKSIRQRDLLNTWLRLYCAAQKLPAMASYQPSRLDDEAPDLVHCTVDTTRQQPRITIENDGARLSAAFGHAGKGRYLDEYLGPRLGPLIMPVYRECISRSLPAYTMSMIDDVCGRPVAYERLLLPFSDGNNVSHIIASLKTISADGGFEIRNLMRGHETVPKLDLCVIIDRNLFHRTPGRVATGDLIEFS